MAGAYRGNRIGARTIGEAMDPYRVTVVRSCVLPICADCRHLQVPEGAPFRSEIWRCRASPIDVEPASVDPITGTRTPERPTLRKCSEVNGEGQCDRFEPMTFRVWLGRHRDTVVTASIVVAVLILAAAALSL